MSKEEAVKAAERYVQGYLTLTTQPATDAATDPQLAAILLSLCERIASSSQGTIIDIGCGEGTLLARLTELPAFMNASGWLYVAVDEAQSLDVVQQIARKSRISRRAEFIELSSFYDEWPRFSSPQIIFCRNVLHELDIRSTAKLISHISLNFGDEDYLLIQDLAKLPVSERRNACWVPALLSECLTNIGFSSVTLIEQPTRSGNAWFSLGAGALVPSIKDEEDARGCVVNARRNQWDLWSEVEQGATGQQPDRGELVEALDLDLQLAALTRQLRDCGALGLALGPETEKRVRAIEFNRRVDSFVKSDASASDKLSEDVSHFRERGEQLTILEEFLRSDKRLAAIYGAPGTGKTTLAKRLLSTRAYEKVAIFVDGRRTKSSWAFIETVFSQVGLRLAPELLSVLTNLNIATFEPALKQFVNAYVSRTILFYDNFNDIQNPDGKISDPSLDALLSLWSSKQQAKVIFGSRSEYLPNSLLSAAGGIPATVRVGRYATGQTVINVLDDSFDRRAAGLQEYPEQLLSAIDRHPLIANLAAQNLKKHGAGLLIDSTFVEELRGKLRDALWNRLVDETSLPALELASQLRVPVPEAFLTRFCTKEAVESAARSELLTTRPHNRWGELYSVLGLFRVRSLGSSPNGVEDENDQGPRALDHQHVSDAYRAIYRNDDDPQWIRESYYHLMLSRSGNSAPLAQSLGSYYYDELLASADFEYLTKRDYASALQLYEISRSIRTLREQAEMRRASCLIRTGRRSDGEKAYADLLAKYPEQRGIRTSHVDALLFVGDFTAARTALENHKMTPTDGPWMAWEWGRVFLGLDLYQEAIEIFTKLVGSENSDPHFHEHYARSLQQVGAFSDAEAVMRRAIERFPDVVSVATYLGMVLEQNGKFEAALHALEPQFGDRNDNSRAAASLVRTYRLLGRRTDAVFALRKAEKGARRQFYEYIVAAQAEVMLANRQPEQAVELVKEQSTASAYSQFILFRTLREAAEMSQWPDAIVKYALSRPIEPQLNKNALIQLERAHLARMAGDRAALAEIEQHLEANFLSAHAKAILAW